MRETASDWGRYNASMNDLVAALRSGRVLLMDGAMGTELLRRSRSPGVECGEQYNLDQPEVVSSIHQAYLDAGADVLLTNTFQANPTTLSRRGLDLQLSAIWQAAIRLARLDPRPHYVLADIGPIEKLTPDVAAALLDECVDVDGVLLETWSSFADLERFADRPAISLFVSFTFHRPSDLMTIEGRSPEECAHTARQLGAVAVGTNCGKEIGMDDMQEIVKRYHDACDLPVFVRANAGTPAKGDMKYPRTPTALAAGLLPLLEEGIAMIGGCCGTTPEHIRRIREVIDRA